MVEFLFRPRSKKETHCMEVNGIGGKVGGNQVERNTTASIEEDICGRHASSTSIGKV